MNAIIICSSGFPTLLDRAWLHTFRSVLNIPESECYGVGDYGPWAWCLLHAFYFVKDPIKCEDIYNVRLKIVVTPSLMSNFGEVVPRLDEYDGDMMFSESDCKAFKYLAEKSHKFVEENGGVRYHQLREMYTRCSL